MFGKHTDGLVHVQPREVVPNVRLGEFQVIGAVDSVVPSEAETLPESEKTE